jgi:protocatechuate 3,4-dioxygenase beta subunit
MDRRHFLRASLGSLAFAGLSGIAVDSFASCPRTEPNVEGPFHRPNAPFRESLIRDDAHPYHGLLLTGVVLDTHCRPLRDAVLEIWQADEHGEYDLGGDRFRACLRTDPRGAYQLFTVHPGHYRNGATYRPAHIHVKVHANRRPVLTTQLYFPRDPHNDADPWFRPSLLVRVPPLGCHPQRPHATFDFVV